MRLVDVDSVIKAVDKHTKDDTEIVLDEDITCILEEVPTIDFNDMEDFCDMAIEALKQVTSKLNNLDDSLLIADSEACKELKSKLELISRREAIEAVTCHIWHTPAEMRKLFNCENYVREVVEKALESLPSADRPQRSKL